MQDAFDWGSCSGCGPNKAANCECDQGMYGADSCNAQILFCSTVKSDPCNSSDLRITCVEKCECSNYSRMP
jgi:hypothetical protein